MPAYKLANTKGNAMEAVKVRIAANGAQLEL